MNIYWIKSQ